MVNLEDEKSVKLGEAISNPNCKKIITLLAEKELTASEISQSLGIPLNSLDYNLRKLIDAGIIEKSKHFWSVKGKKVPAYRVVNKVIVIQPKKTSNSNIYSKLKGISLMIGISALLTGLIALATRTKVEEPQVASTGGSLLTASLEKTVEAPSLLSFIHPWMWFAVGALIAIVLVVIVNWKKL